MEGFLNHINNTDRVWVYQATKLLSDAEVEAITIVGDAFVRDWAAHGEALFGSVTVLYHLFVVVALDEKKAKASGCSIDASVTWITKVGETFGIDFLNRTAVAWMDSNCIKTGHLDEFEQLASDGEITSDTFVFNNLVFTGLDLKMNWLVPASASWHNRYFAANKVSNN